MYVMRKWCLVSLSIDEIAFGAFWQNKQLESICFNR